MHYFFDIQTFNLWHWLHKVYFAIALPLYKNLQLQLLRASDSEVLQSLVSTGPFRFQMLANEAKVWHFGNLVQNTWIILIQLSSFGLHKCFENWSHVGTLHATSAMERPPKKKFKYLNCHEKYNFSATTSGIFAYGIWMCCMVQKCFLLISDLLSWLWPPKSLRFPIFFTLFKKRPCHSSRICQNLFRNSIFLLVILSYFMLVTSSAEPNLTIIVFCPCLLISGVQTSIIECCLASFKREIIPLFIGFPRI